MQSKCISDLPPSFAFVYQVGVALCMSTLPRTHIWCGLTLPISQLASSFKSTTFNSIYTFLVWTHELTCVFACHISLLLSCAMNCDWKESLCCLTYTLWFEVSILFHIRILEPCRLTCWCIGFLQTS